MHTEVRQPYSELRFRVCQDIARGRLPVMFSEETVAGYGSGRLCAACSEPITHNEAEYEVKDNRDDTRLPFHLSCYFVWQLECANTTSERNSGAAAKGPGAELSRHL